MILKYKNEYNDYYELLTFQLRKRLNVLEKRKYILVYLLVPFMIVFLYGWSKGYVTDIKLISNFIFWGIVMVIRVKYSIIALAIQKNILNILIKSNNLLSEKQLEINEEKQEIVFTQDTGEICNFVFKDIKDIFQTEDRIFILRKYDNSYVCTPIIPNNVFKDIRDKEKFIDLISKYISQQ